MLLNLDDITPNNAREILSAVPDGAAMAMGAAVRGAHPFADFVAESPLRTAAFAAGLILAPRRAGEADAAVIGRGLRTIEFGNAVAKAVQTAARSKYDLHAQHLKFCAQVEVKRLGEPQPVGAADLSVPFTDVGDGREYMVSSATVSDGEIIELRSFGRLVEISRAAVFNDDLDLLREAVADTGAAASRMESRLVAAAMDTTGNLSDGNPVFDVAYKNIANSTGAINSADFSAAMAQLRLQPAADGEPLNAPAAFAIVPPLDEYQAHTIVTYAGLPIEVQCVPALTDLIAFYLLASPDIERSIAVARLAGQSHPLAVDPVKAPQSFDGTMIRIRIDTGAAMIGRRGIVRCI